MIDLCGRRALAAEPSLSFPARGVTRILDRLIARHGKPKILTIDNGTEFTCRHFDAWACRHKIRLDFIRPGRPMENGHIESFNGKFRDECLSLHWFKDLAEARKIIEDWRWQYNNTRGHSSLGGRPPLVYLAELLEVADQGTDLAAIFLVSSGPAFGAAANEPRTLVAHGTENGGTSGWFRWKPRR